jgi:hypothetical protein
VPPRREAFDLLRDKVDFLVDEDGAERKRESSS